MRLPAQGKSGSRLTHAQFRNIQQQLWELVHQAIAIPGVNPDHEHQSFLVTNGEVDEEVHRAIGDFNAKYAHGGNRNRLTLMARGDLLGLCTKHALGWWPAALEEANHLLSLMTEQGFDLFPSGKMHFLLAGCLGLFKEPSKPSEATRQICSAAVLTAVALKTFSLRGNHLAVVNGWVLFFMYAAAASERSGLSDGAAAECLSLARHAAFDALGELVREAVASGDLLDGDFVTETFVHDGRKILILGLTAAFWLYSRREARIASDAEYEEIETLIERHTRDGLHPRGARGLFRFLSCSVGISRKRVQVERTKWCWRTSLRPCSHGIGLAQKTLW